MKGSRCVVWVVLEIKSTCNSSEALLITLSTLCFNFHLWKISGTRKELSTPHPTNPWLHRKNSVEIIQTSWIDPLLKVKNSPHPPNRLEVCTVCPPREWDLAALLVNSNRRRPLIELKLFPPVGVCWWYNPPPPPQDVNSSCLLWGETGAV